MKLPLEPILLEGYGVRLEPLSSAHRDGLLFAASDGELWKLIYTHVPAPREIAVYIETALRAQEEGRALAWAVREMQTGTVVGTTRYHSIVPPVDRLELGNTWYALRWQRTHVNRACKFLLLRHAFEHIDCSAVALRTDIKNLRSQRAIEALGAHKDGILRHLERRRDGSVRDVVYYSILASEWPAVRNRFLSYITRWPIYTS